MQSMITSLVFTIKLPDTNFLINGHITINSWGQGENIVFFEQ